MSHLHVAASLRPSVLHLPKGDWDTVLDCLCARFPAVSRETWLDRMSRGRVLDGEQRPIGPQHPYREALRIHYFREVAQERAIPFEEEVLYVDEHLLVADKPHFLPVAPVGKYVEQTLLARLVRRLGNPDLVPLHRIDRLTAGLVLFSCNPASRGRYQALFRERSMVKTYEAIAPAMPGATFPLWRRSRLVRGEPFFCRREVEGVPNSETCVEVLGKQEGYWRYALHPVTGKTHQLRVHMAALGAGICNDPLYPSLLEQSFAEEDYGRPLQLLARSLDFIDPLSGVRRQFKSRMRLEGGAPCPGEQGAVAVSST